MERNFLELSKLGLNFFELLRYFDMNFYNFTLGYLEVGLKGLFEGLAYYEVQVIVKYQKVLVQLV